MNRLRALLTPAAARSLVVVYAVSVPVLLGWIWFGSAQEWVGYAATESLVDAELAGYLAVQSATIIAGGIIAIRKAGHLVGWFLLLAGFSFWSAWLFVIPLDLLILNEGGPVTGIFESLLSGFATLWVTLTLAAIVVFPDGRLISRRWRPVAWLYGTTMAAGFLASVFNGGWGGDQEEVDFATPLREATAPVGDVLSDLFLVLLPLVAITAVVALLVRFVRSSGVERQQTKMLAFASVVTVATLVSLAYVTSGVAIDTPLQTLLVAAAITLLPLAILFAVMRYGLYEIDRVISRTLAYTVVVAALAAVFVAGAVWIPTVLPTGNSNLAVAATTLVVFFLFQPLRTRVQHLVDRRFNRSRYDAQQIADDFAARLRDEIDPDAVTRGWADVVSRTMQPASVGVWLRGRR